MKKKWLFAPIILVLLGVIFYFFRNQILGKNGLLEIDTQPQTIIFINDQQAGETPFKKELTVGEVAIKIFAKDGDFSQPLWEKNRVKINPHTLTLINYNFQDEFPYQSGEMLTLSPISQKNSATLKIITHPNQAIVNIDGQTKGYTPLFLEKIESGQHIVEISKAGYRNYVLKLNLNAGYELECQIKLAAEKEEKKGEEALPSAAPAPRQETVKILPTPNGWLKVRQGPGTSFPEIARVNSGEEFPVLEEKTGWFKIKTKEGQEGWISGQYASPVNSANKE
ncbi:PEGA domain-containing protein [Candidatus Shapirobacteria bacterium]|nr:PEGA domain-containing protein [Candidatus Shapirobacteria bacterium]